MKTRLHSIEGPYFCACVITDVLSNVIVKTAPILHYMQGWHLKRLKVHCKLKKWAYLELCELPPMTPNQPGEDVQVHVTNH